MSLNQRNIFFSLNSENRASAVSKILRIFLIFCKFEPRNSYKKNSYKKNFYKKSVYHDTFVDNRWVLTLFSNFYNFSEVTRFEKKLIIFRSYCHTQS